MSQNLSDYGALDNALMQAGTEGAASASSGPIETDFKSVLGIVKGDKWRQASSLDRLASVDDAISLMMEEIEKDKSSTFKHVNASGDEVDYPMFDSSGAWTPKAIEKINRERQFLQAAAEDENGGVEIDGLTGEPKISSAYRPILENDEKQFDPLHDVSAWAKERNTIEKEGETKSLVWEDFVEFANADISSDEAKIDVDNKELKSEWAQRMQREVFDPSKLGEEVMMAKVGGQWVLNSMNYNEIDKMENAIQSNDELSASDKKMMLANYRSEIERRGGDIVNAFSAVDAGWLDSIYSRPLTDDYMEAMSKPGASAYDFLKANKDRISKDSYGVTSEVMAKFRDALMATGTGAIWLATLGNETRPAEAWGGLAADSSKGYSDSTQFTVFGLDVNRSDLTNLTGQVGSFFAMGGMGALAGKGLLKAGAGGASRYAVTAQGATVLRSTLAAAKAAETAGKASLGTKAVGWLKDAATDPELYLGSLQAAGMGFGQTFNDVYERTGDREQALKAANIDGIANGIGVLIATGVMNRVAPGMGKALGMGDEGIGGGVIQNLRNRIVQREGMKVVQENIKDLAGEAGEELRKQFSKDLIHGLNASARQFGLKGIGVVGNAFAEGIEESADQMISDVVSTMLDDSKTWNEEVWGNISTKWREYVKAGVLGFIGGGGAAVGSSILSPVQTFGESSGLQNQRALMETVKARTAKFGSLDSFASFEGGYKNMAEFIAAPTPEGVSEQDWIKKKSASLVAAVRTGYAHNLKDAQTKPPTADSTAQTPADSSSTTDPPTGAPAANTASKTGTAKPSAFSEAMESMGMPIADNREWRSTVKVGDGTKPVDLGNGETATLVYASDSEAGHTSVVGVKIGKGKDAKMLSPEEGAKRLQGNSKAKKILNSLSKVSSNEIQDLFSDERVGEPATPSQKDSAGTAPKGSQPITPSSEQADTSEPAIEAGDTVSWNHLGVERTGTIIGPGKAGNGWYDIKAIGKDGKSETIQFGGKLNLLAKAKQSTAPEAAAPTASLPDGQGVTPGGVTPTSSPAAKPEPNPNESKTEAERQRQAEVLAADSESGGETSENVPPPAQSAEDKQSNEKQSSDNNGDSGKNPSAVKKDSGDSGKAGEGSNRGTDSNGQSQRTGQPNTGGAATPELTKLEKKAAARAESANMEVGDVFSSGAKPSNVRHEVDSNGKKTGLSVTVDGDVWISPELLRETLAEKQSAEATIALLRKRASELKQANNISDQTPFNAATIDDPKEIDETLNQDTTYAVSEEEIDSNEPDETGGKWKRYYPGVKDEQSQEDLALFGDSTNYAYTPPPGTGMSLEVGDAVLIQGNPDEILVLDRVSNGEWIFRRVKNTGDSFTQMTSRQKTRIFQWNVNRLMEGSKIAKGLLGDIKSGSVTNAQMKSLFMEMIKLVAPRYSGKINETKLSGKSYLQADVGEGVINVDYAKMRVNFQKLLGYANLSNDVANEILATDVARVLAKMVDEEVVHLLASKVIGKKESNALYDKIFADKKSPLHDILIETVNERYEGVNADPNHEGDSISDIDNGKYSVIAELIRKFHQYSTSGSTTETATADSFSLQAAIIRDLKGSTQPGKVKKFINVVREMVRRYSNRVRNILWARYQQGRLPFDQQAIFARLNMAYKKGKIQGDVDYATEAADERVSFMEKEASDAYRKWVDEVARKHNAAINTIRQLPERFNGLTLDQILLTDAETMTLRLNPAIRALADKYKNLLDLTAVDEALAALNEETIGDDNKPIYGLGSYRQAKTVAFLKLQILESKLAMLSPEIAEAVNSMIERGEGDIKLGEQTVGRVLRLLDKGESKPSETARKAMAIQAMYQMLVEERSRLAAQMRHIRNVRVQEDVAKYVALDPSTQSGRFSLMRAASKTFSKFGVELPDVDVNTPMEEIVEAFQAVKDEIIHKAKLQSLRSFDFVPYEGTKVPLDSKDLKNQDEYVNHDVLFERYKKIQVEIQSAAEEFQKVSSQAITDDIKAPEAADTSDYSQLISYLRAVNDFNSFFKNIIHRSIGDFFVNKAGFGTVFTDITKTKGEGASMTFPTYRDDLPEASTPSEVFGVEFIQRGHDVFYHEKRAWVKDGEDLSEEDRIKNEEIDLIVRTAESNAAFAGFQHYNRAYLDYVTGRIKGNEDYRLYLETGGFALSVLEDTESDRISVESPRQAFESFSVMRLNELLHKASEIKNKPINPSVLVDLINHVNTLKKWADKIHSTVGPRMMPTIGGRNTLAARVKIMLDEQFKKKPRKLKLFDRDGNTVLNYVDGKTYTEVDGLVPLVNDFEVVLIGIVDKYFTKKLNNGKYEDVKLRPGMSLDKAYAEVVTAFYGDKGTPMRSRLSAANDTVKMVRAALNGFKDTTWRRNYEQEARTVQRMASNQGQNPDEAGVLQRAVTRRIDNEELLELRESPIDTSIFSNHLWLTKYYERSRDYIVSGNFGFEMVEDFAKASFGEGRLPELYTTAEWKRIYLNPEQAQKIESNDSHKSVPAYSKLEYDKSGPQEKWITPQGDPYYLKKVNKPNASRNSLNPRSIAFDRRENPGSMGTEGGDFDSIVGDFIPGSALTRGESMLNIAGSAANVRRFFITKWGMIVGANSTGYFNVEAAHSFLFDLVGAERDGISSNDRLALIHRGLRGLFPVASSFSEEAQDQFFSGIYDKFKQFVVGKGGESLFSPQVKFKPGINGRFDAEQFLISLGEFKSSFEREVLAEAKATSEIGDALKTIDLFTAGDVEVEGMVDVEEEVPNPNYVDPTDLPFDSPKTTQPKTIKKTSKKKGTKRIPKKELRHNSFASEEEASRIKSLLDSMMLDTNAPIYNASLLVGGIDGVGNSFVSMLIQNLPGRTLVFSPNDKQITKAGLQDVSLKIFIGQNGGPNVVYAPQSQSSSELPSSVAHGAISQLLSIAISNPAIRAEVDRLGSAIEKTLDPVFIVEKVYGDLAYGRAKWVSKSIRRKLLSPIADKAIGWNLDNVVERIERARSEKASTEKTASSVATFAATVSEAYRALAPELSNLTSSEKKLFKAQMTAHLIKLNALGDSLKINQTNGASMSLFPLRTSQVDTETGEVVLTDRGTTSRIMLIAEMMTNPAAKRFFDRAYIGIDEIGDTALSLPSYEALAEAIRQITRPDGEREAFDTEITEDVQDNPSEQTGVDSMDDEDADGEDDSYNTETTADNPLLEEFRRRLENGEVTAEEEEAIYLGRYLGESVDPSGRRKESYGPNADAINDELRNLIKGRRTREEELATEGAEHAPSNALIFNSIARIMTIGREEHEAAQDLGEPSPEANRSSRNMLMNPESIGLSGEENRDTRAMIGPMWMDRSGTASPSAVYVGEVRNLTKPTLVGQTAQNLQFQKRRVSRTTSLIFLGTKFARSVIDPIAKSRVEKTLLKSPFASTFPRIDAKIPLSDELIRDLEGLLPSANFSQHEAAVRSALASLEAEEVALMQRRNDVLHILGDNMERSGQVFEDRKNKLIKALKYEIREIESEIKAYESKLPFKTKRLGANGEVLTSREYADDPWLARKQNEIAERQLKFEEVENGSFSNLEYSDYESAELRNQVRDLVVDHVRDQLGFLENIRDTSVRMGSAVASTLRSSLRNDPGLNYFYNSLQEAMREINVAARIFNAAFDSENSDLNVLPEGTALEIFKKAEVLIQAYNINALILNGMIEHHVRKALRLNLRNGERLSFPIHKFEIKRFRPDSSMALSNNELSQVFDSFRRMSNDKKFTSGFFDILTNEVTSAVSAGSVSTSETNAFVFEIAKTYAQNPSMDLDLFVVESISRAINEELSTPFGKALNEIALLTSEAAKIIDDKSMSADQLDKINKARISLNKADGDLARVRKELGLIYSNNGDSYVGLGSYQGRYGSPQVKDSIGRVIREGVPESPRRLGVNISLTAPGLDVQRDISDTDDSYAAKYQSAVSKWMDIVPRPGEELTQDQLDENLQRKAARREHYIRSKSVITAIHEVINTYIEDSYSKASNSQENFVEFDPLSVILEAIDFAKAEQESINLYFNQASDDASSANLAGLSANAIALLTDPKDVDAMKVLTANQRGKVKMIRMPESHKERVDKIGRYFELDGEAIVLMPVDAKERLMRAFPKTITAKNADSAINNLILDALPINLSPSLSNPNASFSYFFNGAEKRKGEKFADNRFSLTKNPDITRGEAAKLFRDRWLESMQNMMNRVANTSERGTKKVDLSGVNSQKAIDEAGTMVELLVLAHGDPNLDQSTKDEIVSFLRAIDLRAIEERSIGVAGINFNGLLSIKLLPLFSKAFSQIEAGKIYKTLIAGMTLTGKGKELQLIALNSLHHQDARLRHRYMKDYAARETAKRLVAFLDYGIGLKTGRRGYEISKKAASALIGDAAQKVGNSAKNHTLGHLMAVVRGLGNAHGMSKVSALKEFTRVLARGVNQLNQFVDAQENYYGNDVSKYWNGHSLDLGRDIELSQDITKILKKLNLSSVVSQIQTRDAAAADAEAQAVIDGLLTELKNSVEDNKGSEVEAYADTVYNVLTDIHNAMQFSIAVMSQEMQTVTEGAEQKWRDRFRGPFKQSYSSVPLRLSYAVHPDPQFMGKSAEGRYISDPIDIVSFNEASFFGGIGSNQVAGQKNNIYRPIAINGLSSPLSMVDDAIYRLNVTPTYEVLRRSFGKTVQTPGILKIEDGHFLEKVKSLAPIDPDVKGFYQLQAEHEEDTHDFQKAMGGITSELETQIQNDAAIRIDNTGGAEAIRFLGSAYIVRSLASLMQWWDQAASSSLGYVTGKVVSGKPKMAATYLKIVGQILASLVTNRKKWHQIRSFIEDVEPATYYRSADGQDVAKDMLGNQVRFGKKKTRNLAGKLLRKYEQLGEKALSFTIGAPERVIASAVFLTELMELMGNHDLDAILNMNKVERDAIPMMAKNNARVKVNDLMSQSDQSKKAGLFQTTTSSPSLNALTRTLTRFSNHTAGVASNASVLSVPALSPILAKFNQQKWGGFDKQSQNEALENVVQTLVQNILFFPLKLKVMIPLLLSVFFNSLGGDDDDEAIRDAQDLANKILAPGEDDNWLAYALKAVLFGKKRELFQSNKDDEAARSSALAEVMTKTFLEGFQTIPVFGAAAGYSPASALLQMLVTDKAAESTTAMLTGVERARGTYDADSTKIRKYEKDWDENIFSATAPTAMVYDMGAAIKLAIDYSLTTDAEESRGQSLFNTAAYLVAELIPFARELRAQTKGTLKESVYEENRKN